MHFRINLCNSNLFLIQYHIILCIQGYLYFGSGDALVKLHSLFGIQAGYFVLSSSIQNILSLFDDRILYTTYNGSYYLHSLRLENDDDDDDEISLHTKYKVNVCNLRSAKLFISNKENNAPLSPTRN
jgi:hypothetical protein